MKQKNFPERKNARRKNAIQECEHWLAFCNTILGTGQDFLGKTISREYRQKIEEHVSRLKKEISVLNSRIVDSARHIQTKKMGGKVLRQENFRR